MHIKSKNKKKIMKKLLLLCCFSLFAFASKAQLTYLQPSDTAKYLNQATDNIDHSAYIYFKNNTAAPITISWTRPTKEMPFGWNSPGLCDKASCLPFQTPATPYTVSPGDTGYIKSVIKRTDSGIRGCAYAIAVISEPGQPNRTLTFIHTSENNTLNSFCYALATKNFDINKSVEVYPNPASNYINVKIINADAKSVTITNIIGKKIKKYTFDTNKTSLFTIPTDELTNGVYMLQFADEKGNSLGVKKLTKQ